ncbi:hypothetical protein BDF21DRAFT_35978 [Thamnidium elegans]|nr:hypothetical protein BDF21DRAFT_35978 [Thamnidium elegans]
MTRSKEGINRHEKHVSRNGQSESRFGIKKMGAGAGNWGVLGDEVPDVQEVARSEIESNTVTEVKLKLVDSQTFENLRHNEQNSH